MSRAAKTVLIFGIYLLLLGSGLLFFPADILELLEMDSPDIWSRGVGVLLIFGGYYYFRAALAGNNMLDFFRWTVHTRIASIFFLFLFVQLEYAGLQIMVFGVINILGALWTRSALKAARYRFTPGFYSNKF